MNDNMSMIVKREGGKYKITWDRDTYNVSVVSRKTKNISHFYPIYAEPEEHADAEIYCRYTAFSTLFDGDASLGNVLGALQANLPHLNIEYEDSILLNSTSYSIITWGNTMYACVNDLDSINADEEEELASNVLNVQLGSKLELMDFAYASFHIFSYDLDMDAEFDRAIQKGFYNEEFKYYE
jgi:hypothetical protein